MRHHSIICRLGETDDQDLAVLEPGSVITNIQFIDGHGRLQFGIGQAIEQLADLGLSPGETAVDLALLAATLTAADTRISRDTESENSWTREIDLYVPVAEPAVWTATSDLLASTLKFLTGDRWRLVFRQRPTDIDELSPAPESLRTDESDSVCLFSGGMDSFIGAIDLFSGGGKPLLVSHYWDTNSTSTYQNDCRAALQERFSDTSINHVQARVGFPHDLVEGGGSEDTLRARSFLFFTLAAMAAEAIGDSITIHVPENGLISLNVPLDPRRLGACSTRTTHPYYMARVNELFGRLGLSTRLFNMFSHLTKGQMAEQCSDPEFLADHVHLTMSCSSPGKARYHPDPSNRSPKHCGFCVPCIIRRAAIHRGCGPDQTRYVIPDLHAQALDTNKSDGEHVRSFQLAIARLKRAPHRAKFAIHEPGPLIDHPDSLDDFEQVYRDGLLEVDDYLEGVTAIPL
ncbi:Qat anti-phage system QueC-like protein QatC [Pseudomonas sp.]|uniref:Qat anti-phage system QueC-like protein QatC n=1 Tax=Pseudomonas sp. TaxID=306 RepID=UPI00260D5295|nr:Qat anti-phage system QueC-like protein QatC [Pseudomonas sp.]